MSRSPFCNDEDGTVLTDVCVYTLQIENHQGPDRGQRSIVFSYLEKKVATETDYRREELSLREKELKLQRERFEAERAEARDRLEMEREERRVCQQTDQRMVELIGALLQKFRICIFISISDNKATVYSVLDLSNGFHQLRMDPDSVHKTAFVTQNGQFQWRVLPYGLTNSPVTFMRTMHDVLRPYLFKSCIVYVDDIIVFSRDMKEHLRHLRQVFQCLNKAGLKLKPSKCRFAAVEVKYLGHILSREGIRPNPEKTAIIDSFPTPTDVKQVRSFLGLANYYKRFVKDFSVIAAPLFKLLRKDVSFVWDEACVQAFNIIRNKLVQEPILKFPDMSRPFLLTTDASNTGIGYVLSQKDDTGREHAVAYGGRALRGPETRYSTTEQEYLAIKEGIQAYHPYLADKPFTVYTDHKPLKYAAKFRPDMGRLGRWALFLQSYNFATEYKAGKTNLNADTLSRVPFPEIQETSTSQNEQKVPGVASADSLSGCAIHDSIELCSVDPVDMAQMQRRCSDVKPLYQFHSSQTLPQEETSIVDNYADSLSVSTMAHGFLVHEADTRRLQIYTAVG